MSNQLELRQLRYFLAVAEDLHFRRAAERLYISQPGLSRQVRQLEEELGCPLFTRSSRSVALTPAGNYLKEELTNLLQKVDGALHHAQLLAGGMEGWLNFGYVGSAMQNVIPELLVRFRAEYPNVHYGLEALDNQVQIDKLLAREIDIGFVRMEEIPPELEHRQVFVDTFSLVLPADHPLTAEAFTSLAQLRDEPFILFDPAYSQPYYEKVLQLFAEAGFTPAVSHRTVHATTIYRLVENGFGLSIVPTSLQMGYQLGVKFIELTGIPQRTTLSAVWRADNENPALANFVGLF